MRMTQYEMRQMHSSVEPLPPIVRSRTQLDILAATFLNPVSHTIGELAEQTSTDRTSVLREVNRLVDSRVLTKDRVSRAGLISANWDLPWAAELQGILMTTVGPVSVLAALFAGDPSIDKAYIFGSWAARYLGHDGPWPQDIDVLVVGDSFSSMAVRGALADLDSRFGVEVNAIFTTRSRWADAEPGSFLAQLADGPLVVVKPLT